MTAPGKSAPNPVPDLPPLKPRPVAFAVLAVILAAWLILLVVMRLKTIDRPVLTPTTPPASRRLDHPARGILPPQSPVIVGEIGKPGKDELARRCPEPTPRQAANQTEAFTTSGLPNFSITALVMP